MAKIKLSDYVAQFLAAHDINQVFMVVGGGAMHLDDSLGKCSDLKLCFNHHEQACSMAAEGYARIKGTPACVCVTTGPGGINAMTGVAGAYLDSIPMLVISGQVRFDTSVRSSGLPLRSIGDQEYDITLSAKPMTKYAEMVTSPLQIRKVMEKAYHLAVTGRPGPTWVDIPVDIQAAQIDPEELEAYVPEKDDAELPEKVTADLVKEVAEKLRTSKRPVIYAGNGIRISGGHPIFARIVSRLGIPVVTCWDSIDEIEDEHPLYTGRGGMMGDRAGNFAVQNADTILAIGNRLSIRQVGYRWEAWAKGAYVMAVDVDRYEMMKSTVHVEKPIWADAKDFLTQLEKYLDEENITESNPLYASAKVQMKGQDTGEIEGASNEEAAIRRQERPGNWTELCAYWKKAYPVITSEHRKDDRQTNVYAFVGELGRRLPQGRSIVVGNGSACVVGSHAFPIKKDQRFIINSAIASMGYDLPAAIGTCIADQGKETILITGDGSIQMNLQELQTIITGRLPIKIFVINNAGYHSIRQTQTNLFEKHFVGIGPESGGISFPDLSKLAAAYGYPYAACHSNDELAKALEDTLAQEGNAICEVFCSPEQFFEPKSATKKLPDGTLVSPPLDDLKPFLSREELEANTVER